MITEKFLLWLCKQMSPWPTIYIWNWITVLQNISPEQFYILIFVNVHLECKTAHLKLPNTCGSSTVHSLMFNHTCLRALQWVCSAQRTQLKQPTHTIWLEERWAEGQTSVFFVECTFGLPFKYMFAVNVYLINITQVSTI